MTPQYLEKIKDQIVAAFERRKLFSDTIAKVTNPELKRKMVKSFEIIYGKQ